MSLVLTHHNTLKEAVIPQEHDGNEEEATTKAEDNEKTETMQNEMAEKLDVLMNMMFEYIKKSCYNEGMGSKRNIFTKHLLGVL